VSEALLLPGEEVMAMMPVVVGVDGSEESLRAVEWAAQEARRHRAPLRIVAAPVLLPHMRDHAQDPETVALRVKRESRLALDEAIVRAGEVATGQRIEAGLLTGPPAVAVTQSGAGALMLVVGARGLGGFAAMLLGSVSRYAAMQARCPVVVVREETSAVHSEVVVGIRDPRDTTATLGYAFEEAALRNASLMAVHSWHWSRSAPDADAGRITAEAELNLSDALKAWHDKYPTVPAWHDVVHDHPAHVLAIYSARADLVVIGRHDSSGSHPAIGGIQHALLSHARGPVAIVPATELPAHGVIGPRVTAHRVTGRGNGRRRGAAAVPTGARRGR
jgi:nucleotide-binding universal stress UspA family protein